MSKQSLLLVDGDTRSLRVLEVSLRKAGFTVTPASSVADALEKLDVHTPDLIISETKFPADLDGFELRRRVRGSPSWAEIPFVFLTAETAIEHKIKGLELGVDDYLTKPIYIKEIVTRINILLQKRQRAHLDERKDGVRFAGRVQDMPVVDVIQTIEVSRKSGVIQFVADRQRSAAIYFRDGKVIDAEAGTLQGEDAVYRLLTWSEGEFEVVFRTVRRRDVISMSSQGLLMEGMRRLDEWSRLLEQLPPLSHRFEVDAAELAGRLGEVPDDNNPILRLADGKRSLLEVIDASDFGDLECLQAISRLYFEGLLVDLDPQERPKRDTGKPMPLVVIDPAPTPIEEVASGPILIGHLASQLAAEQVPPAEAAGPLIASAPELERAPEPAPELFEAATVDPLADIDDAPGPLMGGYRPSSLRLIDEAVAAAQAIDPSLFESDLDPGVEPAVAPIARVQLAKRESDPRIDNARGMVEVTSKGASNGHNGTSAEIPAVMPLEADSGGIPAPFADADDDGIGDFDAPEEETAPDVPSRLAARGEASASASGLRMIGSLGHDRAEASGELRLPPRDEPAPDPERELVTILPRRSTREVPIVQPPAESADAPVEAAAEPESESDAAAGATATATPVVAEPAAPAPTPDAPRASETRMSSPLVRTSAPQMAATAAPSGVRRATGPGPLALGLVAVGSLLLGISAFLLIHHHHSHHPRAAAAFDASTPVLAATVDAGIAPRSRDAAPAIAVAPVDAARVAMAPVVDAARVAVAPVDAHVPTAAIDADDPVRRASELQKQAADALADDDPDKALALAQQSLDLRKAPRTYLVEARALQRLQRVADALAAVDNAIALIKDYAPAWEERGMILWADHRTEEAKPAFQKYLELDPNGRDAASIREMLEHDQP